MDVSSAAVVSNSENGRSLLLSWTQVLDSSSGHDTPVTRVVGLLKDMGKTVQAEMDEDESLYRKLKCWCTDNNWERSNSIEKLEASIGELQSKIESLSGSTAELKESIKELEAELAADKKSLAEATALRHKQLADFHNVEKDDIQAIENLKAALEILEKHQPPPESTVGGGAIFKSERDSWAMVQVHSRGFPSKDVRSFENFMRDSGLDEARSSQVVASQTPAKPKFLQQHDSSSMSTEGSLSVADTAVVDHALKSAVALVQAHHGDTYYPAYNFRSGEI